MRALFRFTIIPIAAVALLAASGCGNDNPSLSAENDEPAYREGLQFKKEDRYDEALAAYLKVIARRGEERAPESHLEVGLIYLNHVKDPIAAIYHFRKYLELEPNSPQSQLVRGMIDTAKREFARTLPGQPLDNPPALQGELAEQVNSLQRENEDLKAELAALRSGTPAPPRAAGEGGSAGSNSFFAPPPPMVASVQDTTPPADLVPETVALPQQEPTPDRPVVAARTHTVLAGETLYAISKKMYGSASHAKIQAIMDANRGVLSGSKALKPGMVLKIP
jgi:tetratricopeptide (TPR) repeat protein